MSDFIVSARKYRPATFDTVVGQAHITNTLKNAIKTKHLAHAFLFCGPRGVGKTTCARILAKTINCLSPTENIEACDNCESCISFNVGSSHNVFELDAASNNGVDDIRSLIEQVYYAPQLGTHKVYVIDEVHMLSQQAFNAFLKTLEEPPKHAIFILATTEKHKIIPTILSRCQIFDFNRIQIEDIANHLAYIAQKENVTAEKDALYIIAQKADGALRDACSMFDQIVSFAGNNVTYNAVIENLNILDYDYYFKVTDAILSENISESLLLLNEILNNGFDGHNFVAGLSDHFRDLLVSKDQATVELLEVSNNIKEKYKVQSAKSDLLFLIRGLTLLNKADTSYKASKNKRLHTELALIQLCSFNASKIEAEKKNDLSEGFESSVSKTTQATPPKPLTNTAENTTTAQPTVSATPISENGEQPNAAKPSASSLLKKSTIRLSTPSITTTTNNNVGDAQNQTIVNDEARPNKAFTSAELNDAWKNYAALLKEKGKHSMAIVLHDKTPQLKDNYIISFTVSNKAAEESINEDKANFLEYLRNKLNNFSIKLELVLVAEDEKQKLYSAADRFKHLAEINPAIVKLRQTFDLDIEF